MPSTTSRSGYGKPAEVADYIDVAEQTLAQWRWRRVGPPWTKVGSLVRYEWADVDEWLAARKVATS